MGEREGGGGRVVIQLNWYRDCDFFYAYVGISFPLVRRSKGKFFGSIARLLHEHRRCEHIIHKYKYTNTNTHMK